MNKQLKKTASQSGIESVLFGHKPTNIRQDLEPSLRQGIENQINISINAHNAQLPNAALKNRDYSAVLNQLEQNLKLEHPPLQKYNLLVMAGLVSVKLFQFDKARQFLNKAILLDPTNPLAHQVLGFVYLLKGTQTRDKSLLKKAIPLLEKNVSPLFPISHAHVYIGYIHSQLGDWQNAIKEFETALELDPDFHLIKTYLLQAYVNLAQNLEKLEQEKLFDKAITLTEKFDINQQDNIFCYNYLCNYLLEYGYLDQALTILKKTLALFPESILTQIHLGRYYLETQKFSLARTIFKKLAIASEEKIIAALKKDAPEKKIDLHLVYNALWRLYGFSILYLSQGLTSKPSQQKKVSSLITEAEKVFKKALSYNSADITSQLGLGVVYYNQKKWQEAGNEILSVLNVEPTNQDAKNYLDILRQTIGQIIYDACNKRTKKFTKRHEEFPITILVESIIETLNKLLADADSETAKQIFGPADLAQTVVAITEQLKPISAVRDLVFQLYMAGLLTLADAARLAKLTTAEFLNNILGPVEISKEHLSFTPAEIDKKAAIELLQSWQKEKPTPEDDEDWQMTKESIDESRHSTRKLFA